MAAYKYPFGIWKPKPSTTNEKPIIIKKPRHRMTTAGCLLTKSISGLAANSIIPTAIVTAIIITDKSLTIPTAVITLSSENTASSTTICTITIQNTACTGFSSLWVSLPSMRSCSSVVPLNNKNTPPNSKIRSRPEKGCSNI